MYSIINTQAYDIGDAHLDKCQNDVLTSLLLITDLINVDGDVNGLRGQYWRILYIMIFITVRSVQLSCKSR